MTNKLLQENMKLSMEFDTYVSKNPKVLDRIPKGSSIIITSSGNKDLSESNLKIVRRGRSGRFVVASKERRGWKIQTVKK